MKTKLVVVALVSVFAAAFGVYSNFGTFSVLAKGETAPAQDEFDQAAAIAKLREEIKGKEKEPAETVFKNIQSMKGVPAGRLLAIMEFGYARSLGVNCTYCHTPDNWASEDKTKKQIARDMSAMAGRINNELLTGIKNLKGPKPTINCTTCHRGQAIPALNLPAPSPAPAAKP